MAIGFVEMQGQITRAQDFTTVKHNEDAKGLVDQSNFGQQMAKQVEKQTQRVNERDRAENRQKNSTQRNKGVTNTTETAVSTGRGRKKNLTARCC